MFGMRTLGAGLAAAVALVALPAPAQAAVAELQLDKSASVTNISPGREFGYTLSVSCSSLTEGCVNATLKDTLPAEFDVTSIPPSSSERTVTYDSGTRELTVVYTMPLANPSGTFGLPPGQSRTISLGMRLPTQTPVTDGQQITNTAEATADNADPVQDAVDITADIPAIFIPVATKDWAENSAIAQSGATSTMTLGVRNASSTSADVKALQITDISSETFNAFDVTALGPVTYPQGADELVIEACTKPVDSPCGVGEWVESAPLSGPGPFSPPTGVALADITGLRFTFRSSTGGSLPQSATGGTVDVGLVLRDTNRRDNTPLQPPGETTLTNEATPTAVPATGEPTTGEPAEAAFTLLPDAVTVKASKSMFSDSSGSWSANGQIVVGENSGITMKLGAENTSAIPASALVITEPAPGSPSEFDKIDLTAGRIHWPVGSTEASIQLTCRASAPPAPLTIDRNGDAITNFPTFNCPAGDFPSSVTVTIAGVDGTGQGTIAAGALAQVDLHGTAPGVDASDVSDGLNNCVDVNAQTPESSSSTSQACGIAPVFNPSRGGSASKVPAVLTIVPGQYLDYSLTFRNSGNVPLSNVVITDPLDPSLGGEPFDKVRLLSLSVATGQSATRELWDPNVPGFVAYSASDSALMTRATGFRVTLDDPLPPGGRVRIAIRVTTRDGVVPTVPAEQINNCFKTTADGMDDVEACAKPVSIVGAEAGASSQKVIVPNTVTRPTPGLPDQRTTVRHRLANTGSMYLQTLGVTDDDQSFFDAVDFAGNMRAKMPPGANRVRVDVCTTDCAGGTFINGVATASSTPGLPAGVSAADVRGVRVTFSNSSGGYNLLPGESLFTSGSCKDASFCFDVVAREFLRGTSTPIPATLTNDAQAFGTSTLGPLTIPPVDASVNVVDGTAVIDFKKGPNSRIGPGEVAPFELVMSNPGTAAVTDPVIYDPLPDELTLSEDVPGGKPGKPYVITFSNLPSGYPEPATVDYQEEKNSSDPNKVSGVRWTFPGWALPPGAEITIRIDVSLTPGTLADETIVNTAGAAGSNTYDCATGTTPDDQAPWGPETFCTEPAQITSLSGNATVTSKWSAGDAALGWYNTATGRTVPIDDPGCPSRLENGRLFTRYPCVPMVGPNQPIDFLINVINAGTNPMTKAVLVDGLPVEGDTGVLVSGSRGTEWNNRPVMLTPVSVRGVSATTATTDYTQNTFPGSSFCTDNLKPAPADTCPPDAFNAPFSDQVTGFRTTLDLAGSDALQPGEGVDLQFQMLSPRTLDTTSNYPQAWNSFGEKSTFTTGEEPASEPTKAGVAMRFGQLSIAKSVVGAPEGVTLLPFEAAYRCEVDGVEIDSGTLDVDADGSELLPLQPTGAVCWIWEVDSQGAANPNIGPDNAIEVVVPAPKLNNKPEAVELNNDYENGRLRVRKTVSGDAAGLELVGGGTVGGGPFTVNVDCEIAGQHLPDFPQILTINDGETVTLDKDNGVVIPANSDCLVTETDTGNATSVTITVDDGVPSVDTTADVVVKPDFDGGSTVAIDNNFEAGALQINKTLSGAGSAYAQGPFTFSVECTYATQTLQPIEATVTAKKLQTTVSPLPTGATCAVYETDAGDSATPVPVLVGNVVIPASDAEPVSVDADNTFDAGYITVAKRVTGAAADMVTQNSYRLQVLCERPGEQLLDKTVTLAAGESKTLPDPMPIGAQCWATEVSDGGATSTSIDHGSKATAVTVTRSAPNISITATNTFDEAKLRVRKKTTGPAPEGARYQFAVTCQTASGAAVQLRPGDSQFTLAADEGRTIRVPKGSECTVRETDDRGADEVTYLDSDNGTVTLDSDRKVKVKNAFADACSLRVSAKPKGTKVPVRGGKTLVKSAKTKSPCVIKSQAAKRPGIAVRCAPLKRAGAGDLQYCRVRITRDGRVRVWTRGYRPLKVAVRIKATSGEAGVKAKTWRRTYYVR